MATQKGEILKLVSQIERLPTLPIVVQKIMYIVESPETSATDMNRVISADQALTSRVLKLVNSAFYGFGRKITTVTQAIVILGFNTVKSLALSASVFDIFKGKGDTAVFDRTKFWEHSIGVGIASQIIAKKIKLTSTEEAFIGGIIHDIGKVVLDQYLHDAFTEVLLHKEEKDLSLYQAELEVLKVSHSDIGDWLAEQWNLPRSLAACIKYHHKFSQCPDEHKKIAAAIHLGDILARTKKIGSGGDDKIPELNEDAWNRLGINKNDLENILFELERDMSQANEFVNMTK